MVSFRLASTASAKTVKRITLALGGRSPHIILPDADFAATARHAVLGVMSNAVRILRCTDTYLGHSPAQRKN
jgi:acyl-CoA reductase-like NAD-dependent aldehyde dehydrogenase